MNQGIRSMRLVATRMARGIVGLAFSVVHCIASRGISITISHSAILDCLVTTTSENGSQVYRGIKLGWVSIDHIG